MENTVYFPRMGTIKEAADASGLAVYRVRRLVPLAVFATSRRAAVFW